MDYDYVNAYRLYGSAIALLIGVWVMIDATKRGKSGIVAFL